MPAERGGPARHEVAQDRLLGQGQSVDLPVAIEISPKNVGQLEARTRATSAPINIATSGMHRAWWSAEGLASGGAHEVDRAPHGAESHLAQMQVLRGAVEAAMPEQHLDGSNISAQIQ